MKTQITIATTTAASFRRSARLARSNNGIVKNKGQVNLLKRATVNASKQSGKGALVQALGFLTAMQHTQNLKLNKLDEEWDEKRWIEQEVAFFEFENGRDNLLKLPTMGTSTYLDSRGRTKFDDSYAMVIQREPGTGHNHPKVRQAKARKTWTRRLEAYYEHMDPAINIPLAGRPSEPPCSDGTLSHSIPDNVCFRQSPRQRSGILS